MLAAKRRGYEQESSANIITRSNGARVHVLRQYMEWSETVPLHQRSGTA
jgi:hypothetical protein